MSRRTVVYGDGMFPLAVSTNHHCICRHVAAIFTMQVLTRGCEPLVWGRGGGRGWRWVLSSPVMTSYRLPTVTTVCHCFRSALTCHGRTDAGRTDGQTELVKQKAALCTKVHIGRQKRWMYYGRHA